MTPDELSRLGARILAEDGALFAEAFRHADKCAGENAEFIMRACNAHDELVAALRRATDILARYPKHDAAWKSCREALAKAAAL